MTINLYLGTGCNSLGQDYREPTMSYSTDPRVDEYINALPDWQQALCREVRDLVHAADEEVVETIKRTIQPYFVLHGNICALLAAKDHVNVFLYDGGIVPDPEGIITAGHNNKTARTVAIRQGVAINQQALLAMFQQIIANNRAGGWRARPPALTRFVPAMWADEPRPRCHIRAAPFVSAVTERPAEGCADGRTRLVNRAVRG